MKKNVLIIFCLFAVSAAFSQSLEEIVKNYTVANKIDQLSKFQTLKLTATVSVMGMEVPSEVWIKKPSKIKSVTSVNGEDIISVFDGEKGFSVNPMAGSSTPVEMTPDEIKNLKRSNIFENFLASYLKEGKLTLEGDEDVNGSPAFKIKALEDENTMLYFFIDKASYYIVKTSVSTVAQGMPVTIDTYSSDFQEINGFMMAMKSTMSVSGMDLEFTYTKVEVDIPMDDSIFRLN
jgi:hypothetical protein